MKAHANKSKIEILNRLVVELKAEMDNSNDLIAEERDLSFEQRKYQKSGDSKKAQEIKQALDALKTPEMKKKKEELAKSIHEKKAVIQRMEKEIYGRASNPDSPTVLTKHSL